MKDLIANPAQYKLSYYSFARMLIGTRIFDKLYCGDNKNLRNNLLTILEQASLLLDVGAVDIKHQTYFRRGSFVVQKEYLRAYEDYRDVLLNTSLYKNSKNSEHHLLSFAIVPLITWNGTSILNTQLLNKLIYYSHPLFYKSKKHKSAILILAEIDSKRLTSLIRNINSYFSEINTLAKIYKKNIKLMLIKENFKMKDIEIYCDSQSVLSLLKFYKSEKTLEEGHNANYMILRSIIGKADQLLHFLSKDELIAKIENKTLLDYVDKAL